MNVLTPASLDEALAMKAGEPGAVPMAGGTDLMVCWHERPDCLERTYIDLSGLDTLRALQWSSDGSLSLGALTTYWDVLQDRRAGAELPMFHQAAMQVGAVQIQTRGTWAGNIANASPAADGVPVLMAADAAVTLASTRGTRRVALDGFYQGYKEFEMEADELITHVHVPPAALDVQLFEKVGSRRAQAITKVGLALAHTPRGWRVVANSMAPTVCRCPALETRLDEEQPIETPEDLDDAIAADLSPIDDVRSSAAYRRRVFGRVLHHALRGVCPWFVS